jgi:tetratricopeptide (TPR) repeat protein
MLPRLRLRRVSAQVLRRSSHALRTVIVAVLLVGGVSGCAGDVARWIAQTRNHQGDIALARGNDVDAAEAYELALRIAPHDDHARAGFVTVQLRLAQKLYTDSKLEDALDALALAARYSPDDDRIAALRSEIEQAEIKRDIVVSNFPSYKEASNNMRRSFAAVRRSTEQIGASIARFEYTYDTGDLTKAIRQSYELNAEIARDTTRLVTLRQLAESGAPESKSADTLAPPASLLPLP